MSIAQTIGRNTIFEFITKISDLGIAFVVGIFLTRGLGTEQYGLYTYTIWLIVLVSLGTNLGLGEMSRRFIPEAVGRQNSREAAGFVQLSFMFRTTAAVLICLVILFTSGYWTRVTGNEGNQIIFVIAAFYIVPYTMQQTFTGVFKGFQRFDYTFYLNILTGPVRLVLIIIFMTLNHGVVTVLFINIATLILSVLFGVILLRKLVTLRTLFAPSLLSGDRKRQALKYSLIVAGTIGLAYLTSSDTEVFFIGLYHSVEDVGFFKLAFAIAPLVSSLPQAFGFVLLPVMAEQFGKGDMEKLKKIYITATRYLMMVSIPVAAGGIVLADSLITVFYGGDYSPTIILFQIICLPIAILNITNAGAAVIRGINRPDFILTRSIFIAIINVGLSFLLIPSYGILGAAIANSVSLVVALPFYAVFVSKKVGVGWPVADTIKISAVSLLMGLVVYGLHSQLNDVLSLVICIPLGIIIYIVAIFALKIIRKDDLVLFREFLNHLPSPLAKLFIPMMNLLEKKIRDKLETDN